MNYEAETSKHEVIMATQTNKLNPSPKKTGDCHDKNAGCLAQLFAKPEEQRLRIVWITVIVIAGAALIVWGLTLKHTLSDGSGLDDLTKVKNDFKKSLQEKME